MKIIRTLGVVFGIFGLIYLIGVFVQASFDISSWTHEARFATGFIGGMISLIVGMMYLVEKEQL